MDEEDPVNVSFCPERVAFLKMHREQDEWDTFDHRDRCGSSDLVFWW